MQVSHSFFDVVLQYFEECVLLPVFLLAIMWLVNKWKPEKKKIVYAIACGSVLVFNELTYRIFAAVGEGSTYYRVLWIIPVVFVIAAVAVELGMSLPRKKGVALLLVAFIGCFMFSNRTGEEWFRLPKNIYQVDEDVIQVADTLMELTDGEAIYLSDNGNLRDTIRQYNARIKFVDMEEYALVAILNGITDNILGRDLIEAIWEDRSQYLALRKDDVFMYKLMETSGTTLAAETDNYRIYYVDYDNLYKDWVQCRKMTKGLINWATIEYIPIPELKEQYGYVYISNLGSIENEDVYQELFQKIEAQQPAGIIINDPSSEDKDWYLHYEEILEKMQIPYYCNTQEMQIIEQEEFRICMMNNTIGISDKVLKDFEAMLKEEKPVVLVLSSAIKSDKDVLYPLFELGSVVQILTVQENGYTKELLGNDTIQYSVPLDENQIFSMLYIKGLEGKNE